MRKVSLFLLFALFFINANANRLQRKLIKKASLSFCTGNYSASLQALLRFRQEFPAHFLIEETNLKIGELFSLMGNNDQARKELINVIDGHELVQDEHEIDYHFCPSYYGKGENECLRILFPDQYTNLQNKACIFLADIYQREGQFDKSIEYLRGADTQYVFTTNGGNEYEIHQVEMILRYRDVFTQKTDTVAAIKELIKGVFLPEREIKTSLKNLLITKYSSAQIKGMVSKSLEDLQEKHEVVNGQLYPFYEIILFDQVVKVPRYILVQFKKENSIDEVRKYLAKNYFYSLLND